MGVFLSSLIFPGKAHVSIWQWKYKFTITKVWKVIFESKKMSSIWRPVDFDSLGSTAVQEGENSVISISDEEEQVNINMTHLQVMVSRNTSHIYILIYIKKYSGSTFSLATGLCGLAAQQSPHKPAVKEFSPGCQAGWTCSPLVHLAWHPRY